MDIRDRIVGLSRVKARDLAPNPLNWRTHPEAQNRLVGSLLTEIGYADALLAYRDSEGVLTLYDGHLRRDLTPDAIVPVLETDLTEDEARVMLRALDPAVGMAEADEEALSLLIEQIDDAGLEQLLAGGAEESLPPGLDPGVDPDAIPVDAPTRCQSGEIWRCGPHRVAIGDCTDESLVERLFGEKCLSLVWTDPPYGVDYAHKNKFLNDFQKGNRNQTPMTGDRGSEEQTEALCTVGLRNAYAFSLSGAVIYLASPSGTILPRFIAAINASGFVFHHTLIWVKNNFVLGLADYHYKHEHVLYGWRDGAHYFGGGKGQHTVREVPKPYRSEEHPTAKPVALVLPMIENSSRAGDIVYDPFLGSGTTMIASQAAGRICFGCEIEPRYGDVILARWESVTDERAVRDDG